MIDLHTHLLPDWDNGATDWLETYRMARAAEKDGITKICLTPHVFRLTKHGNNMEILETRFEEFKWKTSRFSIDFYQGAEVFIHHDVIQNIKMNKLTVNNSNYVFVEFSAEGVMAGVRDLFYNIMLEGYIPIISHPERNIVFGQMPRVLFDLVSMGSLAQVTAASILGEFGHRTREVAEGFLTNNLVHLIASDAHNSKHRPPLLAKAVERAERFVGEEKARAMVTIIPQAILDNQEVPECGEPKNPVKKSKWKIRL